MSQLDMPKRETHFRRFVYGLGSALVFTSGSLLQEALAAPGDLDISFGNGGVASLGFPAGSSLSLYAIALQPDNKLLLAGRLNDDMLVVRLTASGVKDASFGGGDGIVTIDFAGGVDYAAALVVLADGRIVVGGSARPAGQANSLAAARLNSDGSLDSTFGSDGKASVSQAVGISAYQLVVQSNGKVALAGLSNADPSVFKFARFNTNGTPDTSFGSGGIVTATFSSSASYVAALLQRPSGVLLAVGTVDKGDYLERDHNIVVMQLASNGLPDSNFGNAGQVEIDYPSGSNEANAAALLPDGRLMIAGDIFTFNTPHHSLLVRLHPNGTLDGDFGFQGARAYRLAANDTVSSAVLMADESALLVAGSTGNWIEQPLGTSTSYGRKFVARMDLEGELDSSFGSGGIAGISLDCSTLNLAILTDGAAVFACRASATTIRIARFVSAAGEAAGVLGISGPELDGICESCENVNLLVSRTGGRAGAVSVEYRTVDGTATAGEDYSPISGTLSWADGEDDDKALSVPILPDSVHEGGSDNDAETFLIELHDPNGQAPITVASREARIVEDDDGTAGTVAAFSSSHAASENDGTATRWATRSGGSTGAISVNWSTTSASAIAGADFVAASGTLSWADGESVPKPITVQLIDDNNEELSEVFDIDITARSGGVNVYPTDVFFHGSIEDDDNRLFSGRGGVFLDLASLTDVNGNGTADVATLVSDLVSGSTVYVKDGGSGDPISEITILDADWRAIDLAVTPGGAGAVVAVLAQKDDGSIAVAVHRARDGALVREIPYFGPRSQPSALAYVPNATGPGNSAFAVIAKNIDDQRISVQLRKRSDGTLINTNRFFLSGWEALELSAIDDISGNGRPEIVVLARSDAGLNQVVIKDADTKVNVNKINYFGPSTSPKAAAVLGNIGGSAAPEVTVLGKLPDGRYSAQNRDVLTDERITSVSFFNSSWTLIGIEGLADVNGNGSMDLSTLAQHDTTHAIKAQVRDASTGDLIRTVNFLGPTWSARAFAAFADIDGNGVQEIGVAAREQDGDIRVQLRDASTGAIVNTIDLP